METRQASGGPPGPTVPREELPTGVVTLVFTDIEGSTRLLRQLGPRYAEALSVHNEILRGAVLAHDGLPIRSEGDALFCVFKSPAQAVAAVLIRRIGRVRV